MKKLKVVFDTNIYISATIFPGGTPEELLKLAFSGEFALGVSKEILKELSAVYLRKFHLNGPAVNEQIKRILNNAEFVEVSERINAIKADKSDNRILECAVAFKADVLVSGDTHLLKVKKYNGIRILKPSEFISIYIVEKGKENFAEEKYSKYLTNKAPKCKTGRSSKK